MKTTTFIRENARWLSAGALLTFLSSFGQTFFISLFSEPIRAEFNLTHGEWSSIYAVGTGVSACIMVWAGGLADLFRTSRLGVIVLLGLAGACTAMALTPAVALLVLSICLLRFFGQGMASHTAVVAMSRWFVATRGRALAVCTLGFTLGELIFPISVVSLMAVVDWRLLWGAAAIISLLGVPYLLWALRTERNPRHDIELNSTLGMRDIAWTRKTVLSHPLFWLMIPALLGPSAFNTAFFFHHAHFAEIKGLTQLALVSMFPLYTAVSVAAMIVSGWLVDRFSSARTLPLYQLPMVAAFVCFAVADHIAMLALGFTCLALTAGANSTIPNVFWAEFYGTRHIGAIKAMAAAIMVFGSAIGPLLTGALIDFGIGLELQYAAIAGFFLIATLCMGVGIRAYRMDVPAYRDLRRYT